MEADIGTICISTEGAQGGTCRPPLTPHSPPPSSSSTPTSGGCETALYKVREKQNFDKIILNFAKFQENFTKHEIKYFANISRDYKNKNYAATLLLHILLSAAQTSIC